MSRIEDYNYYRDPRTIESMIDHGKIIEEDGRDYLIIGELKLLCKFDVCGTCGGRGKHTNPSIDCCGLTAEDLDDPEFAEGYFSGAYDVTCNECKGKRVVPVVDREANKKEDIAAYDAHIQDEYDYAREVASERAMGC